MNLNRTENLVGNLLLTEAMKPRFWLLMFVGALGMGSDLSAASRARIATPNVILIVAEQMGFGDLGVNGQARFETPRLDRFAGEGLRFTNYYAGSSLGVVTRGSMMTGRHTGQARIRGEGDYSLALSDTTLGELAKKAGYATAAIGKWGLGGPGSEGIPTVQGFDEWFGYLTEASATNHFPTTLWRNQTNLFWETNLDDGREDYAPYLFTKAATNFITLNRRKPFFLYLSCSLPAAPLQSPTDKPFKTKDWPGPQKTLAAMIYRLDRDIGRVLDTLEKQGLDERTIVLFTSSGGPHADEGIDPRFFNSTGGHRGQKGSLYEGGIRVPLLIRWPGKIEAGRTSDHICAAWDLFPTIAHLMGIAEMGQVDGESLTPTLFRSRQSKHPYLYWESHGPGGFMQAVRSGNWKAVRPGPDRPTELYHLGRDPRETKDTAKRNRRTTRRMERFMQEARVPSVAWPSPVDAKAER